MVGMRGLRITAGTFYADFFAELLDGRVLLVEHERQKKIIGEKMGGKE